MKFNYLKRSDRRNTKAVRNQLQQVDMYKDKVQVCPLYLTVWTQHCWSLVQFQLFYSLSTLQQRITLQEQIPSYKDYS